MLLTLHDRGSAYDFFYASNYRPNQIASWLQIASVCCYIISIQYNWYSPFSFVNSVGSIWDCVWFVLCSNPSNDREPLLCPWVRHLTLNCSAKASGKWVLWIIVPHWAYEYLKLPKNLRGLMTAFLCWLKCKQKSSSQNYKKCNVITLKYFLCKMSSIKMFLSTITFELIPQHCFLESDWSKQESLDCNTTCNSSHMF